MSYNKTDKHKNVTPKRKHFHAHLIAEVEKHPVTYYPFPSRRPGKAYKAQWDIAWEEITSKLGQPTHTCKQEWSDIKYKYAKLMILIFSGKITKEDAMSHPETNRFFDGKLSFLDQYIAYMEDEHIPYRIHKYINTLFGLLTKRTQSVLKTQNDTQYVTHGEVKALIAERELQEGPILDDTNRQYLQTIVDCAIRRKLEELQLMNKTSSNDNESIINLTTSPTRNIPDVSKRKPNLGLQTELIIEGDIKTEREVDDIEENLTPDKNSNTNRQIVIPIDSQNNENIIVEYNTDDIAMANNKAEAISDEKVKKFFCELGEVTSVELSMSKQNILRSRINELVRGLILQNQ